MAITIVLRAPTIPHVLLTGVCAVPNEEKRDCGHIGISEAECLSKECCYFHVAGYPTCYPTIYGKSDSPCS